ncbi:hypothetical protein [Bacteroides thetaiotaomicron]|jgi:RNA recognition motif-containing protein|uniref:hypothetical protein n=1 Tax=Bacteroides thetaiotaomicron TaxID=818 RepID=UPI0040636F2D
MRIGFLLETLLLSFCIISFASCDKDDSERSEDSTVYYVKYEAKGAMKYNLESVTVSTGKGSETIATSKQRSWSQTYGPVSKGFRANITARGGWPTVYIYVCKGDEPFALKESKSNNVGSSNTSTSASYTIDF